MRSCLQKSTSQRLYAGLAASMLKELYHLDKLPVIELVTDSNSLKEHLETTRIINDPRLRVDIAKMGQMKELGEVAYYPQDKAFKIK